MLEPRQSEEAAPAKDHDNLSACFTPFGHGQPLIISREHDVSDARRTLDEG
jgi:hypothetical protein